MRHPDVPGRRRRERALRRDQYVGRRRLLAPCPDHAAKLTAPPAVGFDWPTPSVLRSSTKRCRGQSELPARRPGSGCAMKSRSLFVWPTSPEVDLDPDLSAPAMTSYQGINGSGKPLLPRKSWLKCRLEMEQEWQKIKPNQRTEAQRR